MLKALAEGSGRFQEKLWPPAFGYDPQIGPAKQDSRTSLWISGKTFSTPRTPADLRTSTCLLKFDKAIIPGFRPST